MLDMSVSGRLAARLDALKSRHGEPAVEAIREVVGAMLSTMSGDLSATEAALLSEVEELGKTIEEAKREIAALRVDEIATDHIPVAADELEAIVDATEKATNAIMDNCETIQNIANKLDGENKSALEDSITLIFEACSFQDITGQRINKVVRTLKTIEDRVARIVDKFGDRVKHSKIDDQPVVPITAEDALLNGPQLKGAGVDQSAIDALFD
jgi:chemotaxis protein CheZ